jgi:twitching motility protein PilI
LLTVADLRSFLGAGRAQLDRHARMLLAASREVPTALIVDEVLGFRRFGDADYNELAPATVIRCEHYLKGGFRRGSEVWPRFSLFRLLEDEHFLNAGDRKKA